MTLSEFLKNDVFAAETGAKLTELGEAKVRVTLTVEARHLNAGGVCQGGVLFTMADLAFAAIANRHKKLTFSISSNIVFHHSAQLGDRLVAVGRETYAHHKLPCCEVVIKNQNNELVATFNSMGYRKNVDLQFDD